MLLNTSTAIEMSRRLAWALSQCRWSGGTRRNHRRTVDSGRSIRTAMRRNPRPFALCVNAFPMTSVVSARRTCSSAGNSTWVLVHAVQRARAGCTVTVLAPDPRTVRMRPCPHLDRTPPHSGHAIAPDARCLWASARTGSRSQQPTPLMVVQSYSAPRCHTRGQFVLEGTAFAGTVNANADDRAHRHRGQDRARPWPRHLGVRLRRHVGGADEPNQSENSSASP